MALAFAVDTCLWNLKILADIQENQTLMVLGDRLCIENRMWPGLLRRWSGDSRQSMMTCVTHTCEHVLELLQSYSYTLSLSTLVKRLPAGQPERAPEAAVQVCMLDVLRDFSEKIPKVRTGLEKLSKFPRYTHDVYVSFWREKIDKLLNQIQDTAQKLLKQHEVVE